MCSTEWNDDERGTDRDRRHDVGVVDVKPEDRQVLAATGDRALMHAAMEEQGRDRDRQELEDHAEYEPALRGQLARHQVHREVALLLGRDHRAEHRDRERAAANDGEPPPAEVRSVVSLSVRSRRARRRQHDEREQGEHERLLEQAEVVVGPAQPARQRAVVGICSRSYGGPPSPARDGSRTARRASVPASRRSCARRARRRA